VAGIDLTNKVAVVTGGSDGLGFETARVLATAGADVVITSRSADRGQAAAEALRAAGVKGAVSAQQLDLSDLASVRAAVQALQKLPVLDLLVLNAGVMGTPKSHTKQGFEMQLGTNHFGHFVLVDRLLPKLKAQESKSRVVVVSSKGHYLQRAPMAFDDLHFERRGYTSMRAYAQSKTANVLFASELARRLDGTNVSAYSLHPGSIDTQLSRHWLPLGSWRRWVVSLALRWLPLVTGEVKSIPQGVATTVYAATAPELEGHSGAYLSDCQICQPSKTARDPAQAARLWTVTEAQIAAADSAAGFSR
jgi:NAD(P)-dependent dehydrogenase (short-subunit alcohol dehydrogenase family)